MGVCTQRERERESINMRLWRADVYVCVFVCVSACVCVCVHVSACVCVSECECVYAVQNQ